MAQESGVARVTSILTDQMPKLNALCDEVAAKAQTSVLRAAKVVSDIASDFDRFEAAVTALEDLRGLGSNNPPAGQALTEEIADRAAQVSVALQPAPSENPN